MKKLLLAIIRIYQKGVSPYKGYQCPYYPSCSRYGLEAIELHGAFYGTFLALWRILRCNPFSHGGYDPVPDEIKKIDFRSASCKFRRN
ncbi:MAG: membrane protein insertion efficiency factor YidD [Lachnospiraceae bacterium]|nr:membrane protein insertion efficiency factor YidD [Lachnospiraceae bacterium]